MQVPELRGKTALVFSARLIADIYLGKVKKWNDPEIQKLNPNATLPDQFIRLAYTTIAAAATLHWSTAISRSVPEFNATVCAPILCCPYPYLLIINHIIFLSGR